MIVTIGMVCVAALRANVMGAAEVRIASEERAAHPLARKSLNS